MIKNEKCNHWLAAPIYKYKEGIGWCYVEDCIHCDYEEVIQLTEDREPVTIFEDKKDE